MKNRELPLVTIGIPTFNRSKYLKQALESALNQTYLNIEVIVSDNASTDDTQEIMKQYLSNPKIKYLRQKENIGIPANWNVCLNNANGKYFLLLSDDDILEREAVKILIEKFEDKRVVMSYCNHTIINGNGDPIEEINKKFNPKELESGNKFILKRFKGKSGGTPSSELFITEILRRHGGYPNEPQGAADMAAELILATEGFVAYDKRKLIRYRVHKANNVKNISLMNDSIMGLYLWIEKEDKLKLYKDQMRSYCAKRFYYYLRNRLLRGVKSDDTFKAIEYLKKMSYFKYKELFIFDSKVVRKLAQLRRKIRSKLGLPTSGED